MHYYNVYRLLRIEHDMQIKYIAEKLQVTSAYICAIENGTRKSSEKIIKKYADFFRIDITVLKTFDNHHVSFEKDLLRLLTIICNDNIRKRRLNLV